MTRRAPRQVVRAEQRATVSEQLTEALGAESVVQLDVAAATGAPRAVVQRWCDANEPATITLADVAVLGLTYPAVARRLVQWLAGALGYDLRPHVSEEPGARTGVALVHGMLDAIRLATEHDADGVISEAEARAELAALDEAKERIARREGALRMALGATARA